MDFECRKLRNIQSGFFLSVVIDPNWSTSVLPVSKRYLLKCLDPTVFFNQKCASNKFFFILGKGSNSKYLIKAKNRA